MINLLFLLNLLALGNGFTIHQHRHTASPPVLSAAAAAASNRQPQTSRSRPHYYVTSPLHAAPKSLQDLLDTPSLWDPIKNDLNAVPAFACANDQGQPLQYDIGTGPLAFFFLDINAAKDELRKAQKETAMEGLTLVPFPLGEVFEMGAKQMALIVPSQKSLEDAGAPCGINPLGQQVPLFGCMDMTQNRPDGTSMVPLFLSMEEAREAMDMALQSVPDGDKGQFDITVIPLAGAVQMQATRSDRSFTYVLPTSSMDYLRSLEN